MVYDVQRRSLRAACGCDESQWRADHDVSGATCDESPWWDRPRRVSDQWCADHDAEFY